MLSTLLWLPVVGAVVVGFFPGNLKTTQLRSIALVFSAAVGIVTIYLLSQFDLTTSALQFSENFPWIPPLGLSYKLGIDGLSLPLLALNAFLTILVIGGSGDKIERPRLYYSLMLLVNAGITGAFIAQNLMLFFLFYEIELIPFYLLIAIWGGEKREYAAIKFLLYTAVSGFLVFAAFLAIAWFSGSANFDYDAINTQAFPLKTQLILLILIVVGFGIKIPLVPLHTWLPDAYVESSTPVVVMLGGILAKLGSYGLIRFGLQLFPDTWKLIAPGLAIVGTISVVYGALSAIAQKDIKRMVAYSSIGHQGYILVAAAAGTELALVGAISQMVSHGLILALLFYLVGIIEEKVGTRELDILNGLMNPIRGLPLTSSLLILGGMASAGIPGLVGFIAEFLVFQGSFSAFPIPTLLCIIASGLTAVYFVILLNRTCFGKLDNKLAYYPKVLFSESLPALVLTATILFLGIQPSWLVRWTEATTAAMVATIPTPVTQEVAIKTVVETDFFSLKQ